MCLTSNSWRKLIFLGHCGNKPPIERTHNQVLAYRRAEVVPWVWVLAPEKGKNPLQIAWKCCTPPMGNIW